MATLGKTTITDLNVLNDIKENSTKLSDKYSPKTHTHSYLPLSGGTLNANSYIKLPNTSGIIHTTNTGSNAVDSIIWYKGTEKDSTKNFSASFGWHNTGGTNGNGAAYIIPYPHDSEGWLGQNGLYITETNLKFNNKEVSVAGSTHNGPANSAPILTLNPTGLADATYGAYGGIVQTTADNPTGVSWTNRIKILHGNSGGYYTELAQSFTDTEGLWHRRMVNGKVTDWKKVLDSTGGNPLTTNTYNLGSSSLKWANVYATNFIGNATTATSTSKLGDWIDTIYMTKADNSGYPTLKLICDITSIYNVTSSGGHYGFIGSFIHSRTNGLMREGTGNLIARIGYAWDKRVLTTEDSTIVPCIISYNSKYYIALKLSGSGRGYQLYGYFINKLSEFIELQYTSGTALPSGVTMIEEGTVLTLDDYVKSNTKNLQLNISGTKYYKLVGLKTDSAFSNKNVLISSRNGLSIILTSATNDSTKTFYAYKFCKTKLDPKITNIYYDTTTYDIYMKVGSYFNSITVSDLTNGGYDLTLSEVSSLPTTNLTEIPINEFLHSDNYTDYSLSLKGGTMDGDIVMGGINSSQSINTKSKIIWGTGATISSNGNNVIINPTSSTTTGQIIITPGGSPSITVNGTKVSLDGHTHSYIPTSEKVNATAVTSTNFGTNGTYVPNMNFLSYWNGAYNSSGASNLTYCKHGAFGTAATKDANAVAGANTTTAVSIGGTSAAGIYYVNGTSDILGQSDGALITHKYSDVWISQIYQDYRTGKIALRGKNNGTWSTWLKPSYEGHTHTFTGTAHSHTITPSGTITTSGSVDSNGVLTITHSFTGTTSQSTSSVTATGSVS